MSKPHPNKPRGFVSRFGVAFAAAHALLFFPHCAGDSSVKWVHGDAGEAGSDAAASGGSIHRGGSGGKGGRGGSSGAGRGGAAGSGGAGGDTAGETSGGESAGGREAPGGAAGDGGGDGGGAPAGGAPAAGGVASGGASSGSGGASSGSGGVIAEAGAGGDAGTGLPLRPDFILGADISSVDELIDEGATFVDTDGETKPIAAVLAAHGFNYVRLRTFVDPSNLYGYANPNGDPAYVRAEPYCDRDHTAAFGKQMKDAGMKLLVDLHYSDNWADPGKQVIPEAWRDVQTIEELGAEVRTYTEDLIRTLVDQGARPDIVQLGNEIAPGMLIHVPGDTPNPDQWGNMDLEVNAINGRSSNWTNLGLLLREGVAGVQAVDPSIRIMLHLANTTSPNAITTFINSARSEGVAFDILGLSCYTAWHGPPSFWENTFNTLASRFSDLDFVIAEYGPEARTANDIIRALPDNRGLGTFVWEPTQSGVWGPAMFSNSGGEYEALTDPFAIYDDIREDYGMP